MPCEFTKENHLDICNSLRSRLTADLTDIRQLEVVKIARSHLFCEKVGRIANESVGHYPLLECSALKFFLESELDKLVCSSVS